MKKKSPAKLNVFLKIVGKRGGYHELLSRFVRFENLSDTVEFVPKISTDEFELMGDFSCKNEQNSITKAYQLLKLHANKNKVEDFFRSYGLKVEKNIPEFAGLGGGSSNAASFLLLCNEVLDLGLDKDELAKIGLKIGADLPFFIYEYKSANVGGIGESVKEFEEKLPQFELLAPQIKSSTPKVYGKFREEFYGDFSKNSTTHWLSCSSEEIIRTFDAKVANDLFEPAILLNEKLEDYYKKGYFMSGSGSAMFRIKNG